MRNKRLCSKTRTRLHAKGFEWTFEGPGSQTWDPAIEKLDIVSQIEGKFIDMDIVIAIVIANWLVSPQRHFLILYPLTFLLMYTSIKYCVHTFTEMFGDLVPQIEDLVFS